MVNDLWSGGFKTFFKLHAISYKNTQLYVCYKLHERMKKWEFGQWVRQVETVSFTPPVLTTTEGMTDQVTHFFKRLASCLPIKWDHHCSCTMYWPCCRVTSSLITSAIKCIKGASPARARLKSQHHKWTWWSPSHNLGPLAMFQLFW